MFSLSCYQYTTLAGWSRAKEVRARQQRPRCPSIGPTAPKRAKPTALASTRGSALTICAIERNNSQVICENRQKCELFAYDLGASGDRLTVVRNPKDELKTETLYAVCKQLDIRRDEL